MKEYKDSLLPEDWRRIARRDWGRMELHLSVGDAEAAGFFLQQTLEKYLKSFLLQHGWRLRKIHALHDLLSDAVAYDPELEGYRELCEGVSGYYIADRYPPLTPSGLTCSDIQKHVGEAKRFIKALSGENQ